MRPALLLTPIACLALSVANAMAEQKPAPVSTQQAEFFEKHVRPVFVEHCVSCHGPKKQNAGLRLDSRAGLLAGADSGPVVKPGEPDKSPLIRAIRHTGRIKMPREKLPDQAIALLVEWVRIGAPWPDAGVVRDDKKTIADIRNSHWAFQPVKKPGVPAVAAEWVVNDIDRFVLARLQKEKMAPSAEADRRTLIRRAYFDLIGLPPSPEEVDAFVADRSPDAWEKLIDRLLASPHYGERWGRHWLDVARYADSKGYVFTQERRFPFAYTYRDWVIRAFNEDLPYDQFIVQQLAADQLTLGEDKRPLAAMGFLTLGRRFLGNIHDIIDDRIDVTMRGFQGLTVACARCHDHKYDPIPSKDYYSLHGVFASSVEPAEPPTIVLPGQDAAYQAYKKELDAALKAVEDFKNQHRDAIKGNRKLRNDLRALENKVERLRVTHPGAPAGAMVLVDTPRPVEPVVFLRGNPNNRGERVPRQFLEILSPQREPFRKGSGRLELAQAIASKDNPLTARVLVNRVWMHHFGQGLVTTPSNFGLRGEPPSHPELLDWLAATFVENGWSIKKLHRLIMTSRTYRQKSEDVAQYVRIDPGNRLLWKKSRMRLEFEPLRDSLIFVTGRLDTKVGGPAVELTRAPFPTRRSIYGFIDRQNLPGVFRTFDLASPDAHTPQRHNTTVPQQALFLMNAPFVVEQARNLMQRQDLANLSPARRIERLYRLLFGRAPDAEELALGLEFVAQKDDGGNLGPWERYAQVLLLSNEFAFVD